MTEKTSNQAQIVSQLIDGPVEVVDLDWPGGCGAENVFVGRTRTETHPKYGALERLEYEVYPPMAEKLLNDMAQETAARFGCHAIRIVHSYGAVRPSEASVVIQVATPHRSESFEACRYLIDRLKHELPIWKHEYWAAGHTIVEGCCAHHESDRKLVEDNDS